MVSNFVVEHLWLDNTDEMVANWTGFWGGHLGHVIDGHINRDGEGLYLWAFNDKSIIAFVDILGCWISGRGRIVLRGSGLIFGNTIAHNEIVDFYRRPNLHGTQRWSHTSDARVLEARKGIVDRAGIFLISPKPGAFYPEEAPSRSWNTISRNLIVGGPQGIVIEPGAKFNFLNRNVISVDGREILDDGEDTFIGTQVGAEESKVPEQESP